jgi:hypothetical protein
MRPRVDVGIDAKRDWRPQAQAFCHGAHARELCFRLQIQAINARVQRCGDLRFALANAREERPARIAARGEHPLQFAAGNDIEAGAGSCE